MPQDPIKSKEQIAEESKAVTKWSNAHDKAVSEWSNAHDKAVSDWSSAHDKAVSDWSNARDKAISEWSQNKAQKDRIEKYNKLEAEFFSKYNQTEAKFSAQYNQTEAKFSAQYNQTEAKFSKEYKETIGGIWKKYGWSEELEISYLKKQGHSTPASVPAVLSASAKPQELIKEESRIRAKYNKPYDDVDALYDKKYDTIDALYDKKYDSTDAVYDKKYDAESNTSKRSGIYREGEHQKSEVYREGERKKSEVYREGEAEVKAIWSQYGWSQALEDAYNKNMQEKITSGAVPAAVTPKVVKQTKKSTAEPTDVILQKKEVADAIDAYLNDGYFDFTFESTRLDNIRKADAKTDKINVVISDDGERVVSVMSNGKVSRHDEKTKPVAMSDTDRTPAVKALEDFVKNNTFATLKQKGVLETFAKGAVALHKDADADNVNLTAVLGNNGKSVLIATDKGVFEVVSVKPDTSLPAPSGVKPAAGVVKIK